MTASPSNQDRHVVPRWRKFGITVRIGELDLGIADNSVDDRNPGYLNQLADDFFELKTLLAAGDFLSYATIVGFVDERVLHAARFVLDSDSVSLGLKQLAAVVVQGEDPPSFAHIELETETDESRSARISEMRRMVRADPRNSIRWADLALAHVKVGQLRPAEREIQTALILTPNDRHILRSAARFYVVLNDFEQANAILNRTARVEVDPWILAAELATSQLMDRPSRRIRTAKRLLDSGSHKPRSLSELASELATHELLQGSTKLARRHMKFALIDPTDNSLAQAEWASERGTEPPAIESSEVPLSFEASARSLLAAGDFVGAVNQSRRWQEDQPFDSVAGSFTSYILSVVLADYEEGARAAKEALVTNPGDPTLVNNLVFSLAKSGKWESALKYWGPVADSTVRERPFMIATDGLLKFRQGLTDQGRERYREAIRLLRNAKGGDAPALAAMYYAEEEIRCSAPFARRAIEEALELSPRAQSAEAQDVLAKFALRARKWLQESSQH